MSTLDVFLGPLGVLILQHVSDFLVPLSIYWVLHKALNWYVGRSHNVVFESTLAKRLSAALRLLAANWMFVQDDPVLQEHGGTLLLHLLHCFLFFISPKK